MSIPGMDKFVAAIVSFWLFAHAVGHPEWVWKGITYMRVAALKEIRKPWGCLSSFEGKECSNVTSELSYQRQTHRSKAIDDNMREITGHDASNSSRQEPQ